MTPNFVLIALPPEKRSGGLQASGYHRILLDSGALTRHETGRGAVLVALEADELHQLAAARLQVGPKEPARELEVDRPRERAGIVEEKVVGDAAPVDPRPALDRVELLGVRCAAAVEPELVVVADRIDDERVLLEPARRMAPPGRNRIGRVRPPVHVHHAVRARIAGLMEHIDVRQPLRGVRHRELPRVRIHARHAHRQTRGVGLVLLQPLAHELLRPRQQRKLAGLQPAVALDVAVRAAAHPRTGEVDLAVRQPRNGLAGHLIVGDRRTTAHLDLANAALRLKLRQERHGQYRNSYEDADDFLLHATTPSADFMRVRAPESALTGRETAQLEAIL